MNVWLFMNGLLEHVPKKLLDFFDIKTSDISDDLSPETSSKNG